MINIQIEIMINEDDKTCGVCEMQKKYLGPAHDATRCHLFGILNHKRTSGGLQVFRSFGCISAEEKTQELLKEVDHHRRDHHPKEELS